MLAMAVASIHNAGGLNLRNPKPRYQDVPAAWFPFILAARRVLLRGVCRESHPFRSKVLQEDSPVNSLLKQKLLVYHYKI